jgi:hypothetical protein
MFLIAIPLMELHAIQIKETNVNNQIIRFAHFNLDKQET